MSISKYIIENYSDKELALNRIIVTLFAKSNHLNIVSGFLVNYIIDYNDPMISELPSRDESLDLESVISIFELAIPDLERTSNGAVYTPKYIRDYIVRRIVNRIEKPIQECRCADISCGCGAFLYTLAEIIHNKTNQPYKIIFHKLYGVDISHTSIERAKILLALLALKNNNEIIEEDDFKLNQGDTLTFNFKSITKDELGFDIIVGNPPYVRSKHLTEETKNNMPRWKTSRIGNADLYIPFFEIGRSLLNDNGQLGYITVNTFFKSVNARALREFFSVNCESIQIINFGQQLVFKGKLAYTCLFFLSKAKSDHIDFAKAVLKDIESYKDIRFYPIPYAGLNNHKGWHLNNPGILANIRRIETTGRQLGEKYIIKNGIATLANDIFIFRPESEDRHYYYITRDQQLFAIEKIICKDIIKPNKLKTELDIPVLLEKVIFPYDENYVLINEAVFRNSCPKAYEYLRYFKEVLDQRDKGKGDYGGWYAFGRTQAISDKGLKLLFPYMTDKPHFVYTNKRDMLIYCGYAIFHESEEELLVLKKILESSLFNYYMVHTSKPYSTGYYSYAKNYIKSFGVYEFSPEERKKLLSLQTPEDIDDFILKHYKIKIQ